MTSAVEQLLAVKARIANAEREAKREPGAVTLVAVSKTFSAEDIRPVIEAGQLGLLLGRLVDLEQLAVHAGPRERR